MDRVFSVGLGPHKSYREHRDKIDCITEAISRAGECFRSAKLRNRQYHREPLSKSLGEGLFELRHVGKLNTRVLWFFMKNRRIVLLHGIRNKGRAIPVRELDTGRERMRDWRKRMEP